MAPPANTSATTATVLTLPTTISQNVHDAGTTYTVWFKYTPLVKQVLGVYPFGDVTTYKPTIEVYNGPASAPVLKYAYGNGVPNNYNRPIQVEAYTGVDLFFKVIPNAGNPTPANLTFKAEVFSGTAITPGDILINEESQGPFPIADRPFPGVVINQATGAIKNFIYPMVSGEDGDSIPSGEVLLEDMIHETIVLYNSSLEQISSISPGTNQFVVIEANQVTNKFWVGVQPNAGTPFYFSVTSSGTVSGNTTLTGIADISGWATNLADTILYVTRSIQDAPVKRWDMVNLTFLSDFIATGQGPTVLTYDILVMPNDDVAVGYWNTSNGNFDVRLYNSAGTFITNKLFTGNASNVPPRITRASGREIWAYIVSSTFGKHRLVKYNVDTGTIAVDFTDVYTFRQGMIMFPGAPTEPSDPPPARFGPSPSCPIINLQASITPVGSSGIYTIVPGKTDDTVKSGAGTVDLEIPDPTFRTGLLG